MEWTLYHIGGSRSPKGNLVLGPQHRYTVGGREERWGQGASFFHLEVLPPKQWECTSTPGRQDCLFYNGLDLELHALGLLWFALQSEFSVSYRTEAGNSQTLSRRWFLSSFQVERREAEVKGPGRCCVDLANLHPGDIEIGKADTVLPQFP